MTPTPQESTVAANALYGRHPGFRALHAKGTLLKGTFTATPQAAQLTRAAHMQGEPVPVTARVSNGGGNPRVPDYAPDVRGLAVKLYLPDGSRTDIVTQTVPHFPVSTPEAFLELLHAQAAGRAAPLKLSLFLARHPGAIPSLPRNMAALRPVTSYAACRYYGVHAFRFVDASGGSRYVRYTFVPEREEARLWPWQARGLGRDYLQDEIASRVSAGSVRFALELQVAAPGDRVDDPSAGWPDDRERVVAGTLELTGLETERESDGDVLVFDPGRITDGIELSDDPVLRYRPAAYGDSVAARTGG